MIYTPFDAPWSRGVPFLILFKLVHFKSTKSVQNLQIQMQPKVTGKPMLRNCWTDFNKWYTIRRAVVWIGAVLDFIEIGSH